jgi:hypothetical protein
MRAHFQKRASLASFETHAMVDALDAAACKARYPSRIFIVRLFGESAHGSKSAWPQIAISPNSAVPALPL